MKIDYKKQKIEVLKEGRFIRFMRRGDWEYVQRNNCTGIVIILALTDDNKLVLVEQYRAPVDKNVIEFPAGLVNDGKTIKPESLAQASRRELVEETGYSARRMVEFLSGPTSGGSSADIVTFFLATGLTKVGQGGGDMTESIQIHTVAVNKVEAWLEKKRQKGCLVDPKIYAGLYWLGKYNRESVDLSGNKKGAGKAKSR